MTLGEGKTFWILDFGFSIQQRMQPLHLFNPKSKI